MTWSVEFAPSAVRGLERLPPKAAAAVIEFTTTTLPTNSERMSKPLRGELSEYRSARRGDYRVLFALDAQKHVLRVVRIAHRVDAYR